MIYFSDLNSIARFLALIVIFSISLLSCTTVRYYTSSEPELDKPKYYGKLPRDLSETSGLAYTAGHLFSFNDSGGEPEIFVLDPENPLSYSRHSIPGARNTDWEDITCRDNLLYIGDFGSNDGARDTFTIYTISFDTLRYDHFKVDNEISYSYQDKTPGPTRLFKNPYDCEAMCFVDDSIWIFTKDWLNFTSRIYKIHSQDSGHLMLSPSWLINPKMLVTGADYNPLTKQVWLVGYRRFQPAVSVYSINPGLPPVHLYQIRLRARTGLQIEGIALDNTGHVWMSFEKSKRRQGLLRMKLPG